MNPTVSATATATTTRRVASITDVIPAEAAELRRAGSHSAESPDVEEWVPAMLTQEWAAHVRDDKSLWGWRWWAVSPFAAAVLSFVVSDFLSGSAAGSTSAWHSRERRLARIRKIAATLDTHIAIRRSNAASKGWLDEGAPLQFATDRA